MVAEGSNGDTEVKDTFIYGGKNKKTIDFSPLVFLFYFISIFHQAFLSKAQRDVEEEIVYLSFQPSCRFSLENKGFSDHKRQQTVHNVSFV